ncbi:hypothetical protein E7811_04835 [Aliigemmobacter aestuarii]|uniref:Uncharacterized protein n=1 Tax=Aliigemmobacter aestuarii TaxID=1445661 RepID=A0A4S3MR84_9RHOB|nr:hypothetical protein [Gemmobacter aestuarii]THD85050.1 hypothetical protein E7811_04835 [Gemmobacter aestuarii]
MALELIAAIVAAMGFGGIALLMRKISGSRIPRWFVTVVAAAGLIGVTIWLEYDWFDRVSGELPEGFEIVETRTEPQALRPWTFIVPMTSGFLAMDRSKTARHPERAELKVVQLFAFERWKNPRNALMVFDCAEGRRVPVTEGMNIGPDGTLTGAEWIVPETEDRLQKAACQED